MEEKYSGKKTSEKLADIRKVMKEQGADVHVVSTLDDLAWIFNMRGDDVHSCPLVLSYAVIFMDKVALFMDEKKCDEGMKKNFEESHVELYPYNDVYEYLKKLDKDHRVMVNEAVINSYLLECIPCEIVNAPNPSTMMKAIKNKVEIENTKWAHVMDGVAVTKFMIWLKDEIKKRDISELEVSEKLLSF